jgi:hypothetical protein
MRAEILEETMNTLESRVPFKPFTVVLMNGNRFEVDHPSALAHRDGFAMYIAPGNMPLFSTMMA